MDDMDDDLFNLDDDFKQTPAAAKKNNNTQGAS